MKIPSLKKVKADDLDLLYVDAMQQWAGAADHTEHADLAIAVSDELESRGKAVPAEQVLLETALLHEVALRRLESLRRAPGQ